MRKQERKLFLTAGGTLFMIDRRKAAQCSEQLMPMEQETRLFLTGEGTLFEIDRRKAALCSS
jgi:hypothetical protein